jgi:hypothetical protein
MSEAASASLATQMTKMSADLASSVNIPFEEAGEKIRSALAGEERPLREFGANISEEAVKMAAHTSAAQDMATAHVTLGKAVDQSGKALAKAGVHQQNVTRAHTAHSPSHGGGTSHASSALTEQTKITTRATLVTRGLSYAVNDLERTSDSAANQFRRAGGGMSEFASQIGKFFLPAVNMITTGFNNALGAVLEFFDRNQERIASWGGAFMTVIEDVGSIIGQLGATVGATIGELWTTTFAGAVSVVAGWFQSIMNFFTAVITGISSVAHNFGLYWKFMELSATQTFRNIMAWWDTVPENLGRIWAWLQRNWWNLLVDMTEGAKATFTNLGKNAAAFGEALWDAIQGKGFHFVWTPLLEGFKATTEKMPELMKPVWADMSEEMQKIWDQIAENDRNRAKAVAAAGAPPVKKPGPLGEQKTSDYKLAGASEIGSKEAYSAIARNQASGAAPVNAAKDNTKAVKANTEASKDYLKWAKYQAEKMDHFMNQGMPNGNAAFVVK